MDGSDCSARKLTATRTAIPRVTATFGKSMASASIVTLPNLGESTGAAQPVDEPFSRVRDRPRSVGQDVAREEVTGQLQAIGDVLP